MIKLIVTRPEAVARGLTHYFTGTACVAGHVSERRTNNAVCVECDQIRRERFGYGRTRRARLRGAGGTHTELDICTLFVEQQGQCAAPHCCTAITLRGPHKCHIDHIKAISRGGSNRASNLQLLCRRCNLAKGAKSMREWTKHIRLTA
jgi:5-methylcytosine-specific restriction endonuclease McrA